MTKTVNIFQKIIIGFFLCFLLWYLYAAGTATAWIDKQEHTTLIETSSLSLLPFIFILAVAILIGNHCDECFLHPPVFWSCHQKKIQKGLLTLIFLFPLILVLTMQRIPVGDAREVCDIAAYWQTHDYTDFLKGNYLDIFPNQAGIILILYSLGKLVGGHNYLFFQLCNAFFIGLFYYRMVSLEEKDVIKTFILICGLLFLPLHLYTNFVYGTIPGLALSFNAYYHLRKQRTEPSKKHIIFGVLSALLAVIIKSNYLIFLIALLISNLFTLMEEPKRKDLYTFFFSLLLVLLLQGQLVNGITYAITGQHLSTGSSKWSWVKMGLSENDIRYNGWYDCNNEITYKEANYNSKQQAKEEKRLVFYRLSYMKSHRKYAVRFFHNKNISQWGNPTFQGFWVNEVMKGKEELPFWIRVSFDHQETFYLFLKGFQILIIFGSLLFLLYPQKEEYFFLMLTILGGFIFHTFWEAKGQYILPYFVLMIPMATLGYQFFFGNFLIFLEETRKKEIFLHTINVNNCKEKNYD